MSCEECRESRAQQVPYVAFEAECARHDRAVKRLIIVIVLVVVLLVVSNLAWLYAWNQYDYEVVDESLDMSTRGGGNANYIGNDGDITNYGNNTIPASEPNP